MPYTAEQKREWYIKMRAEGKCTDCGCASEEGKSKCTSCYLKQHSRRKERRLVKRVKGVCTECSESAIPGHRFCEEHHVLHIERNRKLKKRYISEGRCTHCSAILGAFESHLTQCAYCNERKNQRRRDIL